MKIALITHNINKGDGQGRVNYEIARYALQQGAEVWLLANWVEPDLITLGGKWVPVQPRRWPFYLPVVWEFARLASHAVDKLVDQVDVIHAFGYVLRRPHHVNTSQFVHSAWAQSPDHDFRRQRNFYGLYQWIYTSFNARWERQAYQQAKTVVAASQMVGQELTAIGVPENRIQVITNGADPQEFVPDITPRAAVGLPADVPLALFVGDIRTSRKNLGTVLQALTHTPQIHLAVVGTLDRSPYPAMAARLGLADRVHFLGFRRDVPQIMQAVDAFVFPSRYEPFGIVVLEAMASGLPVITASSVGAAPLVTPECGVVLDDPTDARHLAESLERILNTPSLHKSMGLEARKIAEQHSWEAMAETYFKLYEKIGSTAQRHLRR